MTKIATFQKKIRDFYNKNKRDFPWRRTQNPYDILLSEVMLQQTQTSRVIEKYNAFLKVFPTVPSLANAPVSEVLKLWQGLGYNRRALYLKRSAEIITKEYSNRIPDNKPDLIKLPGIGENTAGAILAFAYNIPEVFIETNIRRVFIHEFFRNSNKVTDTEILKLVNQTIDHQNPREFYYALMDYGAYLGKAETNPNRKSKHYTKQSKFEGSLRQVRGKILKFLLEKPLKKEALKTYFENQDYFEKALLQLLNENFIDEKGNKLQIKS